MDSQYEELKEEAQQKKIQQDNIDLGIIAESNLQSVLEIDENTQKIQTSNST